MIMKLKSLSKNLSSNKTKHVLVENVLQKLQDKIEKLQHLIVFLLVKITLIMMKHNFTSYFSQVTKLLQHYLFFHSQSQNGNLDGCQTKHLGPLSNK